ncbi:hypothetical protein [Paenibacillus sp. 1P07SE]|uniref:hypothetical protein n=1 Tax=Paenibacillus sp. 1P07SE TaxID=3132209 RepID=UPI0039A54A90
MTANHRRLADHPQSGQAGAQAKPVELAENGSMAQDMEDLKRLGEDMEQVKTNAELEEEGLVPDPIQD